MTLPVGLPTIAVSGGEVYRLSDGSLPSSLRVVLTASVPAIVWDGKTVVMDPYILDAASGVGTVSGSVPPTNHPDVAPQGFTYSVAEWVNGKPFRTAWTLSVPYDGGAVDLDSEAPVTVIAGTPTAVGPPPDLTIGTVTTLDTGEPATAEISGTTPDLVLDLGIPRGSTVAVGTVTTGAPGSSATVTNSGTDADVVLDFTIPRGDTGAVASVDGQTGAVSLSSTYVTQSRTVTAGTGLSGGGDLSADRTLAVTYGSTAGTAAQGNDSRLSDARTPTAHAASHASGGADALILAQSQIINLTSDLAGKAALPNVVRDGLVAWVEPASSNADTATRATLPDLSGNGNHATLTGIWGWTPTSGYAGRYLAQNGVDGTATVPIATYLQAADSFTLEWCGRVVAGFGTYVALMGSTSTRYIGMRTAYNTLGFVNALAMWGAADLEPPTTPSMYTDEMAPHHIAITASTTEWKFYYKGALVRTVTFAKAANWGDLLIAAGGVSWPQTRVRGVRVYSRVLTIDEIAHNYAVEQERGWGV